MTTIIAAITIVLLTPAAIIAITITIIHTITTVTPTPSPPTTATAATTARTTSNCLFIFRTFYVHATGYI